MSMATQRFTTILACATLPLAFSCADDATGPLAGAPTREVARVLVTPDNLTLQIGESVQLTVLLRDSHGWPLDNEDAGAVQWTSSRPDLVSVSSAGRVHAISAGKASITVENGGYLTYASVRVLPAGVIDPPDLKTGLGR